MNISFFLFGYSVSFIARHNEDYHGVKVWTVTLAVKPRAVRVEHGE